MRFAIRAAGAVVVLGAVLALARPGPAQADEQIALPADYAKTFKNYLSMDRTQDHDQIIRMFANAPAIEAGKAGQTLPQGSIIVAEVYKAKVDKDGKAIVSTLGQRISDKLVLLAVMEKRGDGFGKDLPAELQNNGWDFAAFKPDGSNAGKDLNKCFACHAPLKNTQHLFSLEHIR